MRFRAILISLCITSTSHATTWTVDDDGAVDFSDIQSAIDVAVDGDEILVMPGTYTGTGAQVVDMLGKAVWLHSSDGPDVTIIDGQNVRRGMQCINSESSATIIDGQNVRRGMQCINSESSATIIEGLTFTYGNSSTGGAVLCLVSNPTFVHCVFSDNTAYAAGALYCFQSSPSITNCTFSNNSAVVGGGIWIGDWEPMGVRGGAPSQFVMFDSNRSEQRNSERGEPSDLVIMIESSQFCGSTPTHIEGVWEDGGNNQFYYACPLGCPDLNGDGVVDVVDVMLIVNDWGLLNSPADFNQDGIVGIDDLLIVIERWGPCP